MEFQTEIIGDRGYVRVNSDLDSERSGEALLSSAIQLLGKCKGVIVLDLTAVEIINSYGIGKMLNCASKMESEGRPIQIKVKDGFIKEVINLLILEKIFPIET